MLGINYTLNISNSSAARTKIVEVHIGQDNDVSLMTDDGITLDPNAFEIVNGKNKDEKHLLRIPDSEDRLQVYSKWLEVRCCLRATS